MAESRSAGLDADDPGRRGRRHRPYILIRALTLAPAALLAPFAYLQLVTAAIVGFLWFDDIPGWSTLAGTAVLAASGLYVMYRERKAGAGAGIG
jgi:drug/metabolite transporter (DMT)-like permease